VKTARTPKAMAYVFRKISSDLENIY
jgi:hypothetical protein